MICILKHLQLTSPSILTNPYLNSFSNSLSSFIYKQDQPNILRKFVFNLQDLVIDAIRCSSKVYQVKLNTIQELCA
jgi:hypothetical protein